MIFTKPQTQQQLKKRSGGTANLLKISQIEKSKYFGSYLQVQHYLKKNFYFKSNPEADRIYLLRIQPVGDAPTKMDMKYTPPQHCARFGISMKGTQKVLKNQSDYYYAYHCIYNKPKQFEILKNIIQNGFKIHPNSPNGQAHGKGIYITPSFSTIINYYSKKSIVKLGDKNYELILQLRVKKGSFTMHNNTAVKNDDWPQNKTQWLVAQPSTQNLIVWGIILRNVDIFK